MCRWLAYSGAPLLLKEALYGPANSLIEQSLHSHLGAETTNGDGFGVGWYGAPPTPGVFHSTEPAWNDQNLHELADHISSPNFFAHIRAAIGSSVQQTNCHPFRHDRWLFMLPNRPRIHCMLVRLMVARCVSNGARFRTRVALLAALGVAAFLLVFSGSAIASSAPTIESVGTGIGGEVTVSAHINPQGLETTYEIKLECGTGEPLPCDSIPSERREGQLPADYEVHEVKLTLTGLQPGTYWFRTRASNSAGETSWVSDGLNIPSPTPGAFPEGTGGTGPVIAPYLEAANNELNAIGVRNAEQRAKDKEAEEQKAKEAGARPASEPGHTEEARTATGGISLAATSVIVQSNGTALVKLTCLGTASCRGKLTLTAKGAIGAKSAKGKKTHSVSIGTTSFSISGDETKAVEVKLDAHGRALLDADHGHCRVSLALLDLAPNPQNTQTKTVWLRQGPQRKGQVDPRGAGR